jgi:hypothetical protein
MTFVDASFDTLHSRYSATALKYLELNKESILQTSANLGIEDFTPRDIGIMSYVGEVYRTS